MERIHGGDWAAYELEYGKQPLDFSASLSPLGMPGRVYQAAVDAMRDAGRYPDPSCRRLRAALSEKHGVDRAQIVCGAGAADLIDRLARVLQPKRALLPAPTFSEYESALRSVGCKVERFPLPGSFHLQEEFVDAITPETDAVFLCNPNNPTGLLTEPTLLRRCLERGVTLIVDECFLDLTDDPARYSMVPFLRDYPNLILLRAFTKTFAMAGLRLGYALCGSAETARALQNVGQPWPESAAGVEASHYVTTGWLNGTKSDVASASAWRIGSSSSAGGGDPLYGTIKSVRLYDRLLSEDELAWNRSVDSARYFGELTVTNVVVDGKYANYEGRAAGAYEVLGSATFTAGAATDAKGKVRPVVGYTVEAWNPETGIWGTAAYHAGSSYAYTVGTDPAKVRLTWKWQPAGTVVIFR